MRTIYLLIYEFQLLIDSGADVNAIYRGAGNVVQTPLDCALLKGYRSTAKFLQLHGGELTKYTV